MESTSCAESLPSTRLKAIEELTKGQILTNKLREMLGQPEKVESDLKSADGVVVQILGMFDNTLSILSSSNLVGIPCYPTDDVRCPSSSEDRGPEVSEESIKTIIPVKTRRGCYKRKKNTSTIIKFTSTIIDDGYSWRKYGQKAIFNSKHQRCYYRCGHKFEQGCQATKQVQKTDDEPSKYKITYNGLHTCTNLQRAPQIIMEAPNPMDNSILISFETNTLTENNFDSCFRSIKNTPKEDFPSLGHPENEVSSFNYHTPRDPIVGLSQVHSESMSVMSSGLDRKDMVSSGMFSTGCSTNGYEIDDIIKGYEVDDIIEGYDFDDLLFE